MAAVILNNLKTICEDRGIDKYKLSEMAEICLSSASKYMSKCKCSIEKAKKIAKILNVELDELRGIDSNIPKVTKYDTPCQNQACLLNKNCICHNDMVLAGRGSCEGKSKVKPKMPKGNWDDTKALFIKI